MHKRDEEVEALKRRIAELEAKVAALEARPALVFINPTPLPQPSTLPPIVPYINPPSWPTVTCCDAGVPALTGTSVIAFSENSLATFRMH